MRCQRVRMSISVWSSMCPMCRDPVTLGGGITMENTGPGTFTSARNSCSLTQNSAQQGSIRCGSYALAISRGIRPSTPEDLRFRASLRRALPSEQSSTIRGRCQRGQLSGNRATYSPAEVTSCRAVRIIGDASFRAADDAKTMILRYFAGLQGRRNGTKRELPSLGQFFADDGFDDGLQKVARYFLQSVGAHALKDSSYDRIHIELGGAVRGFFAGGFHGLGYHGTRGRPGNHFDFVGSVRGCKRIRRLRRFACGAGFYTGFHDGFWSGRLTDRRRDRGIPSGRKPSRLLRFCIPGTWR